MDTISLNDLFGQRHRFDAVRRCCQTEILGGTKDDVSECRELVMLEICERLFRIQGPCRVAYSYIEFSSLRAG